MKMIDTSTIELINLSESKLFFYRQFVDCVNCPLIHSSSVSASENRTIKLRSYFDQNYVITQKNQTFWNPINVSSFCNLCESSCEKSFIALRDKAEFRLIIDNNLNCHLDVLNYGQNQWLNASIVIIIFLALFSSIVYGHDRLDGFWKRFIRSESPTMIDSPTSTIAINPNSPTIPVSLVSKRFHSIDSFRGMTILLMIFVNYGAGNLTSLKHVPWDGFNLADSVFPFFIFIMGSTIAVSFRNISTINENRSKIITRILKRSMNLFVLGIIINSIGSADIKTIRIPGVLQRFALSYGIVALTQLVTVNLITSSLMPRCLNCFKLWPQYALASIMLFIYLYFTLFWQFDQNCPIGYMGPGGLYDNISYPFCIGGAAHKIDEIIFTKNHCYRNNFGGVLYDQGLFNLWHDPEGLLGTTTSIILTVVGLQVGHTILHNVQPWARFRRLINIVVILAIAACFSVFVLRIPINKNLWSFSFVALNGCLATSIFIIFHYLIDHRKIWPKGYPLNYPGQNSIMLYLGHEIANDMFPFKLASSYSSHIGYLAQDLFSTAIWWIISCWMASKQIFITV